jgi:signal peptidase
MFMAKAPRPSRWRRWCGVVAALLLAATVGAFALTWHQGYRAYIVHTGSMAPTFPSGDLVIDRGGASYARGDVITFEHGAGPGDLVTHRITRITARGIETKGDANATGDAWTIRPDQVHGVLVTSLPNLGYAAYFLQVRAGVGALMCCALALLLLWGLFFPGQPEPAPQRTTAAPGRPRWRRPAATWHDMLVLDLQALPRSSPARANAQDKDRADTSVEPSSV